MAKAGLSRLFSSLSEHSISKPSFTSFRSDSVTRFLCSSAQQSQLNHGEKADEEDREVVKGNLESRNKEEEGGDEEDHVNKETGEVGGPKGPEPTRYGDWERNGRCSDF